MIKRVLFIISVLLLFFLAGFLTSHSLKNKPYSNSNMVNLIPKVRTLDKYAFENLNNADIQSGKITKNELLTSEENFDSYLFTFEFIPEIEGKNSKKTTGMLNVPKSDGPFPIILLLRGYVDQTIYQTGVGTKNTGYYFAENGFMTIAPDFLGYAGSDIEADDIFESRFQTYITALSLLKSFDQLENWDKKNIFIWGHSNGGQIALTLLEITGQNIPTVLWAPVSKPFPYSVLYYTDESADRGKLIRRKLSEFEETYDVEKYSLTNYLDWVNKEVKIQIHQGTNDDAVPVDWTNKLVEDLKNIELDIEYYLYSAADHNLRPTWDLSVERSLNFFRSNLNPEVE
jgi:dienelactone hydrolase